MKPRKVLVAIVSRTRRQQLVTCELACGHTAVIRRQSDPRKPTMTRCDACTEARGAENDRRWVIPRPFCKCGCGQRLPTGNRWYVNRAHSYAVNRERMAVLASKGATAAWGPGGKNYERYKARVRERLDALIPRQATFGRDEVLRLANQSRVEGYAKGFAAARARYTRGSERRLA